MQIYEISATLINNGRMYCVTDGGLFVTKFYSDTCTSSAYVTMDCEPFTCGAFKGPRTRRRQKRLVGGRRANDGDMPSTAIVYHVETQQICVGTIIAPMWIVTSARCISKM